MIVDPHLRSKTRRFVSRALRKTISLFTTYEKIMASEKKEYLANPLKSSKTVYALAPWMQDFSILGIRTRYDDLKRPFVQNLVDATRIMIGKEPFSTQGSHANQHERDRVILPLVNEVFNKELGNVKDLRFLDTFSNAGFYSYYAASRFDNVNEVVSVEASPVYCHQAEVINKEFSITDKVTIRQDNVYNIGEGERFDISFCMGGLYHVDDPRKLIELLCKVTTHYLIAHSTIIYDETKDDDFIISPAPGLTHGSRFSYGFFRKAITDSGMEIITEGTCLLPCPPGGNVMYSGKAAYFLARKLDSSL